MQKLTELDRIIAACLGLHLEAVTEKPAAQPGENLTLQIEAINRSPVEVKFQSLRVLTDGEVTPVGKILVPNEVFIQKSTVALPKDLPFSQPYWLREPGTIGTYAVSDQTLIGRPENPPPFSIEVTFQVGGEEITYSLGASVSESGPGRWRSERAARHRTASVRRASTAGLCFWQ